MVDLSYLPTMSDRMPAKPNPVVIAPQDAVGAPSAALQPRGNVAGAFTPQSAPPIAPLPPSAAGNWGSFMQQVFPAPQPTDERGVPLAPPAAAPTAALPTLSAPTRNGDLLGAAAQANALPANAFATPLKFHALTGEHADSEHNNAFLAMLGASNGSFAPGSVLAPTAPAQIAAMQALDARNAPQAPQAQPFYVGKSNRDLEAMKAYAAPGMPRFLTPAERAQGSALNSALSMLNQQRAAGRITDDQYIHATRSLGQPLQTTQADLYGNALTGQ
jgi:hypothetical protein